MGGEAVVKQNDPLEGGSEPQVVETSWWGGWTGMEAYGERSGAKEMGFPLTYEFLHIPSCSIYC